MLFMLKKTRKNHLWFWWLDITKIGKKLKKKTKKRIWLEPSPPSGFHHYQHFVQSLSVSVEDKMG